jgi:CRISPR-associated protein Csx14
MSEASIPVDLFNPGQALACLGFLEAADMLLGDAEGRFDWCNESDTRFWLKSSGKKNPFAHVLRFVAEAELTPCEPPGFVDKSQSNDEEPECEGETTDSSANSKAQVECYPNGTGDRMALVIRVATSNGPSIDLGHWADGSTRNEFKLYAGNRSAFSIARAMLLGTREKPKKNQSAGDVKTKGIKALLSEHGDDLIAKPFDVLTLMGGSFNMDPRGAWTALDAGYSPNKHKSHGVGASPIVEFMAAWGLEHARPDKYETRKVRYSVWGEWLPPILARAALAGAHLSISQRSFRFTLDLSGKNKVVTFAQEEPRA